jgi:hypothetical protein
VGPNGLSAGHRQISQSHSGVVAGCRVSGDDPAQLARAGSAGSSGRTGDASHPATTTGHRSSGRADRLLPHGWCLLPPLQTCDKGNACLTCSVFVTDDTHRQALERQLAETGELITRTTAAFRERHGRPMPDDNVWLAQRRAEQQALTRLLTAM